MKLNSDGCSKGNSGPSGGCGVVRDQSGMFVHAYAISLGIKTNNMA